MRLSLASAVLVLALTLSPTLAPALSAAQAASAAPARASDLVAGLISRSDLVLAAAPWQKHQSMPLGNGRLGAGVWAADGFTAQLNRGDTFPALRSAGQLVLPGLFPMSSAADYQGRLNFYDAAVVQQGGGMSARAYIRADADQLVVEVSGADPSKEQTADFGLWAGRTPRVRAAGEIATVAETFTDPANGRVTGQIAVLTAQARNVRASVTDALHVRLTFRPQADGTFRILLSVPFWSGSEKPGPDKAIAFTGRGAHEAWWRDFWRNLAPMRIDSADGSGEYFEALRVQQFYMAAASMRGAVPASHGGVTSLFSSWRDAIHWSSENWWHFNLRQPVHANLGAGVPQLNAPYNDLYLDRVNEMTVSTRTRWPGSEGICVAEFLRYDGTSKGCANASQQSHTGRILSTGPEVVNNLWLHYQFTKDETFLRRAYPLMAGVGRFYLSVLEPGTDGYLHLNHINALEVQWNTTDPTPDLAAMRTVFPIIAAQADKRGDSALATRLRDALNKLPPLSTTTRNGKKVLAWSASKEPPHNTQNPELETVWPWWQPSPLLQDTFTNRVFHQTREWASDAQWAARLGRAADVKALLIKGTTDFQIFPNGFGAHSPSSDPVQGGGYYDTWNAVVASTLQEALVQSFDGSLRIAAAWPAGWDVNGAAHLPSGHRVHAQVRDGAVTGVTIRAASAEKLTISNPWPGKRVTVRDGDQMVAETSADSFTLDLRSGRTYAFGAPITPPTGSPARFVKTMGARMLGVATSVPQIHSDLVSVLSPEKLRILVTARPGVPVYVDRGALITTLPAFLHGAVMIAGSNEDAKLTAPADYMTLRLTRPATISVAFDPQGENVWWPSWLSSFERIQDLFITTDQRLVVFRKIFQPGLVTLGPNSDVKDKGGLPYAVLVSEPVT